MQRFLWRLAHLNSWSLRTRDKAMLQELQRPSSSFEDRPEGPRCPWPGVREHQEARGRGMRRYHTRASTRVVDSTGSFDADGERQTAESRIIRERPDAVHDVRGYPDQIPLTDFPFLIRNLHDAAS